MGLGVGDSDPVLSNALPDGDIDTCTTGTGLNAPLEFRQTDRWAVWTDRVSRAVLLASAGIVLLVAASFFRWAVMVDDDVVRATRPAQAGWWNYVFGFVYLHWQGRWASAGLESAVLPRVDLVRHYRALLLAVAAVDLAAVFTVIRHGLRVPTPRAIGVTAVVAAFLWSGIPSPAEAVYWFVGAVENALDIGLAAIVIVAVSRARPSAAVAVVLGIAAFVVCGFHELYGAMFCLVLATGTVAAYRTGSPRRGVWLTVTLFAAAGLILVVISPGNTERRLKEAPHGMQPLYDLRIMLSQLRYYPRVWLVDPRQSTAHRSAIALLSATLLLACSGRGKLLEHPFGRFPWKWVVPPVWIAAVLGGFFGPSLAFGRWMPERTLSGVWIVFVSGWFASVYLWTRDGRWRTEAVRRVGTWIGRVALAVALLTTGNITVARSDYRNDLHRWHDGVEQRYADLETGRGRDVVMKPLPRPPKLLRTSELYRDGPDIYLKSWSFYFGQKSVRVDPPVDEKASS